LDFLGGISLLLLGFEIGGLSIKLILALGSAKSQRKTLIVPDKDADGLSAGVIVWRTLVGVSFLFSIHTRVS